MAEIRYKGQIYSGVASVGDADDVNYDNSTSGLTATDVQGAVDETVTRTLTFTDTSVPESGSSAYTINDCKRILCGKTVYISARITANANDTTATTRFLVKLDAYPPKTTGGVTSIVSINGSSSVRTIMACVANITQSGGSYWLCQGITNTINSGDVISIFAVYEAA